MAKELLVTDALSEKMIQAGGKLVERLDADAANIKSALWLYFPDSRNWKLILASETVETDGPRKLYEKIQGANRSASEPEETVSLNDIVVSTPKHELISELAMMIGTGQGISGIRFTRNNINGIYIDDAYIYRSIR
jgi:hypothetical protein